MENSAFVTEIVALRIAIESLTEVRYKLRMMGIDIYKQSHVFCDKNMWFGIFNFRQVHLIRSKILLHTTSVGKKWLQGLSQLVILVVNKI